MNGQNIFVFVLYLLLKNDSKNNFYEIHLYFENYINLWKSSLGLKRLLRLQLNSIFDKSVELFYCFCFQSTHHFFDISIKTFSYRKKSHDYTRRLQLFFWNVKCSRCCDYHLMFIQELKLLLFCKIVFSLFICNLFNSFSLKLSSHPTLLTYFYHLLSLFKCSTF